MSEYQFSGPFDKKFVAKHKIIRVQQPSYSPDFIFGCARGVVVIVVGNEHSDTSSNPGRD